MRKRSILPHSMAKEGGSDLNRETQNRNTLSMIQTIPLSEERVIAYSILLNKTLNENNYT